MTEYEKMVYEMHRVGRQMAFEEQPWIQWLFDSEAAVCEHEWDITSEFGPDTASDQFHCVKCGAGHRVVWY